MKYLYKDRLFYSPLEARYAAFFDLAGWTWQHKPPAVNGWAPDFYVKFPCGHSECGGYHELLVAVHNSASLPRDSPGFDYPYGFWEGDGGRSLHINVCSSAVFGCHPAASWWEMGHGSGGGEESIGQWLDRDNDELDADWQNAASLVRPAPKDWSPPKVSATATEGSVANCGDALPSELLRLIGGEDILGPQVQDGVFVQLHCPVCGFDYTHVQGTFTRVGADAYEATVYDGTEPMGVSNHRRSALVAVFSCEQGCLFGLVVQQIKGVNFLSIEVLDRSGLSEEPDADSPEKGRDFAAEFEEARHAARLRLLELKRVRQGRQASFDGGFGQELGER